MPEGCISIKPCKCTSALGLGLALRLGAGSSALPYIGQAGSDGRTATCFIQQSAYQDGPSCLSVEGEEDLVTASAEREPCERQIGGCGNEPAGQGGERPLQKPAADAAAAERQRGDPGTDLPVANRVLWAAVGSKCAFLPSILFPVCL